ncbi:MAG: homocysteine S-methyltransferase family protein, partial [Chloroflexi bacterium]|nr:homocysteine S-methyltransferase family protein [Chloroflexota bacterium]
MTAHPAPNSTTGSTGSTGDARRDRRLARLPELLAERILVLDGAMGTMIQTHTLDEAAFRGERFRGHPRDLRGANDLLVLTQPAIISDIHAAYL